MSFTYNRERYDIEYASTPGVNRLYLHSIYYNRLCIAPNPNCDILERFINMKISEYYRCCNGNISPHIIKKAVDGHTSNSLTILLDRYEECEARMRTPYIVELSIIPNIDREGTHIILNDNSHLIIQPSLKSSVLIEHLQLLATRHIGDANSMRYIIIREIVIYYHNRIMELNMEE